MSREVFVTPIFEKQKKKLKKNQLEILDEAVRSIIEDPEVGEEKKGDLSGVFVYKFKMFTQEYLLGYEFDDERIILLAVGVHENYYKKLKKQRKR